MDEETNQGLGLGCCLPWPLESVPTPHSSATSIPVVSDPCLWPCEHKEEERRGRIQITNVPCKFLMAINAFL